jgi:hypothetical protein
MNPKLLHDVGQCVVIAQYIEYWLSVILMLERDKKAHGEMEVCEFIDSLAKIRADCYISTLESKLRAAGVPSAVLTDLPDVSKRRNHIAHRLVHDASFLRALRDPAIQSALDDDLRLFVRCANRLEEYFRSRAKTLSVPVFDTRVASDEQIFDFADRVRKGIEGIRDRKP